jgi:hypothetical protein
MLFFKVIFEFNFGTTLGKNLLEAVNNLYYLGFIKFRTDPNNKTGYLIHEVCLPFKTHSTIQIYPPE